MPDPVLLHWCCKHSAQKIRATYTVVPYWGLSWWTDINKRGWRSRDALGLSSVLVNCDRMEYRVLPTPEGKALLVPWQEHIKAADLSPRWVQELQGSPNAKPEHWWVATVPVPVSVVTDQLGRKK